MALPRSLAHPHSVNIPARSRSFAGNIAVLLAALATTTTLVADPFTGTWKISDAKTLTGGAGKVFGVVLAAPLTPARPRRKT